MSVKTTNGAADQKGFSLLELLLVVAVGAVLILAGLAAYRLVSENNNVNEAMRLLNTLKQQVQTAYQGEGQYTATNAEMIALLRDLRAFPAGVLNAAGDTANHPFGGTVTFEGTDQVFTISFNEVRRSACIAIGQAFDVTADSDLSAFEIDGANPDTGDDGITLADLQTACPAENDEAGTTLSWEFF